MSVYLDYNASAPIDERVLDCMIEVYKNNIGNADSRTHDFGERARQVVEKARQQVASILTVSKEEVFFTSGATESNNIVIQGLKKYAEETSKKHIITTSIEHKAVLESAKALAEQGFEVDFVSPDQSGRISTEEVISKVRDDTLLVAIMHVNNETGVIQPVRKIGDYLSDCETLFHVDATQSFGKLVDELRDIKYDTLAMSAHKIYGPQGIGALIMRKKHYKLPPIKNIMYGGQQEHGIRPGTTPVALVAGFGKACELAENEYKQNAAHNIEIKNALIEILDFSGLKYSFNGEQEYCMSSTMNICLEGVSSEALMLAAKQYCGISNGSACNSNSYNLSYVLKAMDIPDESIKNSIRLSWGEMTDLGQVKEDFSNLLEVAKGLIW